MKLTPRGENLLLVLVSLPWLWILYIEIDGFFR